MLTCLSYLELPAPGCIPWSVLEPRLDPRKHPHVEQEGCGNFQRLKQGLLSLAEDLVASRQKQRRSCSSRSLVRSTFNGAVTLPDCSCHYCHSLSFEVAIGTFGCLLKLRT